MAVLWPIFLPPFFAALFIAGGLLLNSRQYWLALKRPKKKLDTNVDAFEASNRERAALGPGKTKERTHEELILHFEPHSLSWNKISVSVGSGLGTKEILRGCAGEVAPGEMAAIVGPSGAGKSTLLDVLAMRVKQTQGYVLVDDSVRGLLFRRIATYIPQEEFFIPTLTVWETLWFYSRLRLPVAIGKEDRHQIMEQLLRDVGLLKVKSSQVGGLLPGACTCAGISGGERRRLHVCTGIVAAPSFIFLDEPTSGLDSHASLVLMGHMKRLAGRGRTLICSIHQPRLAIWDLFDKVEVLSEGRLLYFGPRADAVAWFTSSLGFSYNAARDGTFSDWLLDTVSITFKASKTRDAHGLQSLAEVDGASLQFLELALPQMSIRDCPDESSSRKPGRVSLTVAQGSSAKDQRATLATYPTSFANQLVCLMWRTSLSYLRNPADVAGRVLLACSIGSLGGLAFVYLDAGTNRVVSEVYALNFLVLFSVLGPLAQLSFYTTDRVFYLIDIAANLYRPSAYFLAHTLTSLPATIIQALILFLTTYGLAGFKFSASAVLVSCIAFSIQALNASQVLIFSCYLAPNQDMAAVLASAYIVLNLLLAGFPIPLKDLISPFRVLSYLTYARYTLQILVREQWLGTSKQSLLNFFDFLVPNGLNFLGLISIFLIQLVLTFSILWRMAQHVRK
eukprot:jgi/Botrbrau1/22084/Bobra.0206s0011.1